MSNNLGQERKLFFGISRHRMAIDGKGITTLVGFMGCPLKCKYCLNEQCHTSTFEKDDLTLRRDIQLLSPKELYDIVKIDNIYFQTTGGGICFGGGEPIQNHSFIIAFAQLCPTNWKITLETSLHCSLTTIEALAPYVHEWIIDIKDMNGSIYKQYTGVESKVVRQLKAIKKCVPIEKITIKVPHIPHFNTDEDVKRSVEELQKMGFTNIVETNYIEKRTNI